MKIGRLIKSYLYKMIKQTTREHYSKFESLSKKLADRDIKWITRGVLTETKGLPDLKFLFSRDPLLNNISLKFWDTLSGASINTVGDIHWFNTNIDFPQGLSLAERVCLLKHVTIYKIIKAKPEFGDQTLL